MCDDFYSNNDVDIYENVVIPENIEDPFDALAMAYNPEEEKRNKQKIREQEEQIKKDKENKLLKEKKEKERLDELNKKKETDKKKIEKKGRMIPKNTTKFIDNNYDDY
jgi:hypothetical protein